MTYLVCPANIQILTTKSCRQNNELLYLWSPGGHFCSPPIHVQVGRIHPYIHAAQAMSLLYEHKNIDSLSCFKNYHGFLRENLLQGAMPREPHNKGRGQKIKYRKTWGKFQLCETPPFGIFSEKYCFFLNGILSTFSQFPISYKKDL